MENDDERNGMTFTVILANDIKPAMQPPEAIVIEGEFTHGGADAMVKLVTGPGRVDRKAIIDRAAERKWKALGRPSTPITLERADFE